MTLQGWDCEIAQVYRAFDNARVEDEAHLLRSLHASLVSAPAAVAHALGEPCTDAALDGMLANHCCHDAAYRLTGRATLLVSRDPSGAGHATIVADGLFEEMSFRARNVPLAIGGALAAALALWADTAAAPMLNRATH